MMRDIIGIAQTGTGKTASFVLPMIDILAHGRRRALMPRSLILEPTRELAAQVAENFEKYGKNHDLKMALLIGGVQMGDQVKALSDGVDVLIATPGRLMDLFERGKILLTGCELLVIDEADRMLDMGFIPDIETICSKLPPNRQTLLFSATMPPVIKKLADKFLSNAELQKFKDGVISILVASDVAARGLDVKGVSHVFNYDTPWHPDDYVHRIGRTGRAGASGRAFTFVTDDDAEAIANVEKLTGMKIPVFTLDGGDAAAEVPVAEKRERAPRAEKAPRKARAPKAAAEPVAEVEAPREVAAKPVRARRDEPRPPKDVLTELPSQPGEWNGPVPGFLSVSAL